MNKYNIKVGQTMWVVRAYVGPSPEETPKEHKVEKVGRKYFYLEGFSHEHYKFSLKDLFDVDEYSPSYQCFLTKDGYGNLRKEAKIRGYIKQAMCSQGTLSLDILTQIKKLIDNNKTGE